MFDNAGAAAMTMEETAEFDRLARLVGDVTGFRDGPGLRGKLRSIFGGCDEDTASTWMRRLGRRGVAGGEWQSVLERLTVHETYFFRDAPQINLLRTQVLPSLMAAKIRAGDRSFRVWSAGCSSGEEPYTLAMLILDAMVAAGQARELPGFGIQPDPGWVVQVYGTDISARTIERARSGLYSDFGLSAFRETPPQFRRFFVRHDQTKSVTRYRMRADASSITCFGVHNLREGAAGSGFDVVSCRNVLIYFDDHNKRAALRDLAGAVAQEGYLLLGPTDSFDELDGLTLLDTRVSPILRRERMGGGK